MLSFRKKIFIAYVVVLLAFIALIFPFAGKTVKRIVYESMRSRNIELISKLAVANNDEQLIHRLKELKPMIFFRVSVISDDHKVIYDSHIKRKLGPRFSQEFVVDQPEVLEAFARGDGYNEEYSDILQQKFAYMATAFDFHGKTYVIRTAFPYKYVVDLTHDFELGFIGLSSMVLLLFSVLSWLVMHQLTSPIQQIITDITPYQEGRHTTIPEIRLRNTNPKDDFGRLAMTLNSLSAKIQNHIDTLTDERNEKEAILESLMEGVIATDEEMTITYANLSALKLLGKAKEQLLDQRFSAALHARCYELLVECQREGVVCTDACHLRTERGKLFVQAVAAPKRRGGAVLVLQDQSSHYRMLEMRKDFVANASHELKTPITIIQGFAETLQDNPDLPLDTVQEITGKIVRNCQRMAVVIRDLLTLADIENIPESRLVECDLEELAQQCRERILETHTKAEVKIGQSDGQPMSFTADPHLIELAIYNLLDNAVKYSQPPVEITMTLRREGGFLCLDIADKGIGIPPHALEHIFERFYTVDKARSKKMGGSGLGLSIVQTILDKHCGKISVKSVVGEGSTFTLQLPAAS